MKRYGIFIILFFFITFMAAWMAGATSIVDSKHNLSSNASSTQIRASGTEGATEVCVYCHTPHHAKPDAPLWNRTNSTATYQTYTSDVLAGLGYPSAEDPKGGAGVAQHVKTRICLSCHDGTIALGNLINYPYPYTDSIPMQGPNLTWDNKLTNTAPGYIGTDLRDDHPVAIKYTFADPELNPTIGGNKVKVYYYDSGTGRVKPDNQAGDDRYVECTSCHNPHNNEFGKFLVETNQYSGLCYRCHKGAGASDGKTGFPNSAHNLATAVSYSPPTGGTPNSLGTTVAEVKCMNCHFPHKAGVTVAAPTTPNPTSGKYLLSFQEEASCFNNNDRFGLTNVTACHGTNVPLGDKRRIEPELNNTSRHNINNYADKHKSVEVKSGTLNGWFASSVWHVECEDCHNPHSGGNGVHTQGTNTISSSSSLYGVAYVSVAGVYPAGSWDAPTSFNPVEPLGATTSATWGATPVKEYEVCFKCHSYFAGTGSFPNAFSSLQQMSDQSKEFNVNNSMLGGSFHPVVTSNSNTWGAMFNGWNTGSQLMYCSDCHTKEDYSNPNRPKGPHGSSKTYLLPYTYYDDKATPKTSPNDASGTLCLQCHDPNTYSTGVQTNTGFYTTGGTNLHTQHYLNSTSSSISQYAYRCVNCHIRTPHGWNRKGMIHLQGDNASHLNGNWYEPVSGPTITGLNLPASRGYDPNKNVNCQTISGCH